MEFISKISNKENLIFSEDLGIDAQLDTKGVILDMPFYCAYCMTIMHRIEHDKYRCPQCHIVFNDGAA